MTFDSVKRNTQALQKQIILAEPASLRECADRLEHAARGAIPGESIICELTSSITVVFRPEIAQISPMQAVTSAFQDPPVIAAELTGDTPFT